MKIRSEYLDRNDERRVLIEMADELGLWCAEYYFCGTQHDYHPIIRRVPSSNTAREVYDELLNELITQDAEALAMDGIPAFDMPETYWKRLERDADIQPYAYLGDCVFLSIYGDGVIEEKMTEIRRYLANSGHFFTKSLGFIVIVLPSEEEAEFMIDRLTNKGLAKAEDVELGEIGFAALGNVYIDEWGDYQ